MTLDEFSRLASAWGGDVARWPEANRDAAARLAAGSPEAAALLMDASSLDDIVAAVRPVIDDDRIERMMGRVTAAVAAASIEADKAKSGRSLLQRWFMPASSFASAAVIGVGLGVALPVDPPDTGAEVITAVVIDGGPVSGHWGLE